MRRIEEFLGMQTECRMIRQKLRTYGLYFSDENVAVFRWPKAFHPSYTLETADGYWDCTATGFWRQQYLVRKRDSESDIASVTHHWRNAIIRTPLGNEYVIQADRWWGGPDFSLSDPGGRVYLKFKNKFYWRGIRFLITPEQGLSQMTDASWMTAISAFYVYQQIQAAYSSS